MTIAPLGGRVPTFEMRHRLALALEQADLSVNDIADELGVHRNTIGRYLAGKHVPRSVLIAWSVRTGVPLGWLEYGIITDDDDPVTRRISSRSTARYCADNDDKRLLELVAA